MKQGDEDISRKSNSTTLASSLLASIACQKHLQPQFWTPPESIDTSTIASEEKNNRGIVGNVSNQPSGNVSNQPASEWTKEMENEVEVRDTDESGSDDDAAVSHNQWGIYDVRWSFLDPLVLIQPTHL